MTSRQTPTELILLPSLTAHHGPQGGLVLTQKYMNGAAAFAKHWPGPVSSLVKLSGTPTTDMDHVEILPGSALTSLEQRPTDPDALAQRLAGAAVVLGFLSRYEAPVLALCQRIGVPIVFTSEYSPKTERQIVDSQTQNPLLRLRRKIWISQSDRVRRGMLRQAAGLQCSGTPTHDSYQGINPHTLLFFDNRVPEAAVISDAAFEEKIKALKTGRPLRLVFGGRLIAMKGVMDLPQVAAELRKRDVPFSLDVYGSGPQEQELAAQIAVRGLSDHMVMRGVLDFATGWVPALKADTDLFVCCHPQGDPSSTYPEVMSCGVPIAGYDNEALRGIIAHSNGGWATPMQRPARLADVIARLHHDRTDLAAAARRARDFACQHAFEPTMLRRAAHLLQASRLPDDINPARRAAT